MSYTVHSLCGLTVHDFVWSCTQPCTPPYHHMHTTHHHMQHYTPPHATHRTLDIITALEDILHNNGVAYVHCWGGRGRSGTIAACLLGKAYGLGAQEALERVDRAYRTRENGTMVVGENCVSCVSCVCGVVCACCVCVFHNMYGVPISSLHLFIHTTHTPHHKHTHTPHRVFIPRDSRAGRICQTLFVTACIIVEWLFLEWLFLSECCMKKYNECCERSIPSIKKVRNAACTRRSYIAFCLSPLSFSTFSFLFFRPFVHSATHNQHPVLHVLLALLHTLAAEDNEKLNIS